MSIDPSLGPAINGRAIAMQTSCVGVSLRTNSSAFEFKIGVPP